jgi:hypothetical protein
MISAAIEASWTAATRGAAEIGRRQHDAGADDTDTNFWRGRNSEPESPRSGPDRAKLVARMIAPYAGQRRRGDAKAAAWPSATPRPQGR